MNSLNIISARVSPSSSPGPSRTNSMSHAGLAASDDAKGSQDSNSREDEVRMTTEPDGYALEGRDYVDEKTPLLSNGRSEESNTRSHSWHVLPSRVATSFINSLRWVLSTIAAPGVYLIACLYDERGNFTPLRQLRKLFGAYDGDARKLAADYHEHVSANDEKQAPLRRASQSARGKHAATVDSRAVSASGYSSSGLSSESESDVAVTRDTPTRQSGYSAQHSRSKSTEEIVPSRRSIRIRLQSNEDVRQRKHRKAQSASANAGGGDATDLSAQLKSPTSPVGALTKYPKTPAPPRPLIPQRQPSYIPFETPDPSHLKTLILDLDETLIHSMSKGGRMGSGHMIEVRLNTTYVGAGGHQTLGPQHPILYYVHKRPHCDEFLRKVCDRQNQGLCQGGSVDVPRSPNGSIS